MWNQYIFSSGLKYQLSQSTYIISIHFVLVREYLVGDEGGHTVVEVVQFVRAYAGKVVLVSKDIDDTGQPTVQAHSKHM